MPQFKERSDSTANILFVPNTLAKGPQRGARGLHGACRGIFVLPQDIPPLKNRREALPFLGGISAVGCRAPATVFWE